MTTRPILSVLCLALGAPASMGANTLDVVSFEYILDASLTNVYEVGNSSGGSGVALGSASMAARQTLGNIPAAFDQTIGPVTVNAPPGTLATLAKGSGAARVRTEKTSSSYRVQLESEASAERFEDYSAVGSSGRLATIQMNVLSDVVVDVRFDGGPGFFNSYVEILQDGGAFFSPFLPNAPFFAASVPLPAGHQYTIRLTSDSYVAPLFRDFESSRVSASVVIPIPEVHCGWLLVIAVPFVFRRRVMGHG